MKDFILNMFQKKKKTPSLLAYYILDVTFGSWMHDLYRKNQIYKYEYNLFLK